MPAADRQVIFVAFDEKYAPWAGLFFESLARHHPEAAIHAAAIDLTPARLRELGARHPRLALHPLSVPVVDEGRPAYIANHRPRWLRELMDEVRADCYALMDVDLLARGPLHDLFGVVADADAGVVFRPGFYDGRVWARLRVAAGLLLVRPSGVELVDRWLEVMETSGPVEDVAPWGWFWEQTCLYRATQEVPLRYAGIPAARFLRGYPFRPDAVLWSANVSPDLKATVQSIFERELASLPHP